MVEIACTFKLEELAYLKRALNEQIIRETERLDYATPFLPLTHIKEVKKKRLDLRKKRELLDKLRSLSEK